MPRKPRLIVPGQPHHVISRFTEQRWFIKSKADRDYYLKLLGNALEESDWRLLSYAIMSNHIHLVSIAGKQPLSEWVRAVHSPFASAVNRSSQRVGQVFVRGPKAYLTPAVALKHLIAYVHNNPVRAGVCGTAIESSWTSHRAYLGREPSPRPFNRWSKTIELATEDTPAANALVFEGFDADGALALYVLPFTARGGALTPANATGGPCTTGDVCFLNPRLPDGINNVMTELELSVGSTVQTIPVHITRAVQSDG